LKSHFQKRKVNREGETAAGGEERRGEDLKEGREGGNFPWLWKVYLAALSTN
jgi:hypothetical protein